ncbi:MAG: ribonuclease Z [Nitrospirota bacterium]|jgi:ribonuclease Z
MKPSFHHRLVNGPFEDPCLYVRFLRERRAFLFDAGNLGRLGQADLLKLSDVFISHTHIDHFIGFDTVLRALLRREAPLRVFGPRNLIECVEGKLRGYTWNLVEQYPLVIEAFAIEDGSVRASRFSARARFRREDRGERPFDGSLLREESFRVRAAVLEHDTDSVAYALEEDIHINIDKAALEEMGLPVGPWLSELKALIRRGAGDDTKLEVAGRPWRLADLRRAVLITEGQKISFTTDASPTGDNLARIESLVAGSHVLYCEAYFLDEDRGRARERHHLTAAMAGRLAREAGVKTLVPIHFSPKYRNAPRLPRDEALEAFAGGR